MRDCPWFRIALLSLGSMSFAPHASAQTQGEIPPGPNVLLIIADDLGTEQVGCYNPSVVTWTPNIDLLAEGGARFTSCWANPVCSPSRASILTGKYVLGATGHGVDATVEWAGNACPPDASTSTNGVHLSSSHLTLPAHLNSNYKTALIGKWHLDYPVESAWGPVARGWGFFQGVLKGGVTSYTNWQRYQATSAAPTPVCNPSTATTTYITSQIVDDALAWIQSVPSNKSWFCCVSFTAPHEPFELPPSALAPTTYSAASCDPTGVCNPQLVYRAMVEAMDTEIGGLLTGLGNEIDNTIVIFTSDNGTPPEIVTGALRTEAGCPKGKGTPYEGGVRVPLIICDPLASPASTLTQLVHVRDIFNTVAQYTGAPVVTSLPSTSLRSCVRGLSGCTSRTTLITDSGGSTLDGFCPSSSGCSSCRSVVRPLKNCGFYAIRDDAGFKLIQYFMPSSCSETLTSVSCAVAPGGQLQQCLATSSPNAACGELFFDLNVDPNEQSPLNLSSLTSAQSSALAVLQAALVAHVGAGNWPPECN